MVTRRDQLGIRKRRGKGKGKKGDDQDEGEKVPKKGVKAPRKKKGDGKSGEKPPRKTRKAKDPKDTEASDSADVSKGDQKKPRAKGKAKASPKKKASPKATPKASRKRKSKSAGAGSCSPSDAAVDAAVDAPPEKPEPKRRARRVATPQAARGPSSRCVNPEDFRGAFRGEISHQWKSGKSRLTGDDFPPFLFQKTTLSCYYTRSRPSVGLRAKKKDYPMRTNLECYNFSFNLKDVCNIGLAMKCAVVAVSCPMMSNSNEII